MKRVVQTSLEEVPVEPTSKCSSQGERIVSLQPSSYLVLVTIGSFSIEIACQAAMNKDLVKAFEEEMLSMKRSK